MRVTALPDLPGPGGEKSSPPTQTPISVGPCRAPWLCFADFVNPSGLCRSATAVGLFRRFRKPFESAPFGRRFDPGNWVRSSSSQSPFVDPTHYL